MNSTIILRHRRENLKKCSLKGLEKRSDLTFCTYPKDSLPSLKDSLILSFDGPLLSPKDRERGLFLIDGTWRYAEKMFHWVEQNHPPLETRSLPQAIRTAYPRKQEDCQDPERGLASVEALYTAYVILGWNPQGLLDHYYWAGAFLEKNQEIFCKLAT